MSQPIPNIAHERAMQSSQAGVSPTASTGNATAQVIALSELHSPSGIDSVAQPVDMHVVADDTNPLHRVKATLTVCVGSAVLSIGELLKARKDQVFCLDSAIHDPVDLLIEGKVVARGQLVAMEDRFAVRITHLPQALKV